VEEISRLKHKPGQDILVAGSGELVQFLMQNDLVDEYRLMIHPVILGGGKRLFRDGTEMKALKLMNSKALSKDIIVISYQPEKKDN
jgi:dihydrofolate reductase